MWGDVPNIGTQVAEFSRKYFLSFAIVAGTLISAYDYGLYNFDRVCHGKGPSFSGGTYDVTIVSKEERFGSNLKRSIEVAYSSNGVRVCNGQKCCQQVGLAWPPVPSRLQPDDDFTWMTDGQKTISTIFGGLSAFVVVAFLLGVFGHTIWTRVSSYFLKISINQVRNLAIILFSKLIEPFP